MNPVVKRVSLLNARDEVFQSLVLIFLEIYDLFEFKYAPLSLLALRPIRKHPWLIDLAWDQRDRRWIERI
jgi:hypothetical protein